jgi:deoxyribose-phosphate aldolase
MKQIVGDRAQVKASGGVRSFDDALAMIEAGAS